MTEPSSTTRSEPRPLPPEGPRPCPMCGGLVIATPQKYGPAKLSPVEREAASPVPLDVEPIREVLAAAAGLDPVNVSVGIVRDLAQVQYDRLTEYARLSESKHD